VLVLIVVAEVAALLGRIVRFINENLSEFILEPTTKYLIVCFVAVCWQSASMERG
jgi:hypothetical protein